MGAEGDMAVVVVAAAVAVVAAAVVVVMVMVEPFENGCLMRFWPRREPNKLARYR